MVLRVFHMLGEERKGALGHDAGRSPEGRGGWLGPPEAEKCRGGTREGFCCSDSNTSGLITVVYAPVMCQRVKSIL